MAEMVEPKATEKSYLRGGGGMYPCHYIENLVGEEPRQLRRARMGTLKFMTSSCE